MFFPCLLVCTASEEKTAISCRSVSKDFFFFFFLSLPLQLFSRFCLCLLSSPICVLTVIYLLSLLREACEHIGRYGAQRAFSDVLLKSQSLELQGVYSMLDHSLSYGFCPSSPVLCLYPILSLAAANSSRHLPSTSPKRTSLQIKFQFLFPQSEAWRLRLGRVASGNAHPPADKTLCSVRKKSLCGVSAAPVIPLLQPVSLNFPQPSCESLAGFLEEKPKRDWESLPTWLQPPKASHSQTSLYLLVTQSCLTLWDPMNCSPPGSSLHGIFQARIMEWVAFPFSRESSQPRDGTHCRQILYPLNHQRSPSPYLASNKPLKHLV